MGNPRVDALKPDIRFGPEHRYLAMAAYDGCNSEVGQFIFPLNTKMEAKSMLMRVYGYFRALRIENEDKDLIRMVSLMILDIVDESTIRFRFRSTYWDAKAIRDRFELPSDHFQLDTNALPDSHGTKELKELRYQAAQRKLIAESR